MGEADQLPSPCGINSTSTTLEPGGSGLRSISQPQVNTIRRGGSTCRNRPTAHPSPRTSFGTRRPGAGRARPPAPATVRTVHDPARLHQEPRRNQRISEYGQPGKPSNGARTDPQDSDRPLNAKPGSEPQQCSSLRVGSTCDGGGDHEERRRRRSGVSSHQEAGGVGAPHIEQFFQPTRWCDGQEQADAGGDGSTGRETVSRIHAASGAAPSNDVDSLSGKGRHSPDGGTVPG